MSSSSSSSTILNGDRLLVAALLYFGGRKYGRGKVAMACFAWVLQAVWRNIRERQARTRCKNKTAIIIGAGASGVIMGRELNKLGIDFTILEKNDGVGGCWRTNTYPGCEADVVNALYSFSFAPNPNWSKKWASQPEILKYIESTYKSTNVLPNVKFNTNVKSAKWCEETKSWTVSTHNKNETFTADYLISCCGMLRDISLPSFPKDDFKGKQMHTASWENSYDFSGKTVACIGTGSSGVQAASALAGSVKHMTIFMRTPPWIGPKKNSSNSHLWRWIYKFFPSVQYSFRLAYFLFFEVFFKLVYDYTSFAPCKAFARRLFADGMEKVLKPSEDKKPGILDKMIPKYPIGCKRVCLHSKWLKIVQQDNVDIVGHRIDKLTKNGILTEDGAEREFDAVFYATGFKATNFLHPVEVVGLGGLTLDEAWQRDDKTEEVAPAAYLGIAAPKFPNLFFLNGPATNGTNSIFFSVECQAALVAQLLGTGSRVIEATQAATDRHVTTCATHIRTKVFTHPGCGPFEKLVNKRDIPNAWYGSMTEYYLATRRVQHDDWILE